MKITIMADYYPRFRCKCGDCKDTCCSGWQIGINQQQYFNLIGLECSETLHRKIESAFTPPGYVTVEKFRVISPNWLGFCPMLDEVGLCMLHKECGPEVLPDVCRLFPRADHVIKLNDLWTMEVAVCSGSCEGVLELIPKTVPMKIVVGLDSRESQENETFEENSKKWEEEYTLEEAVEYLKRSLEQEKDGKIENSPLKRLILGLECILVLKDTSIPLTQRVLAISEKLGYSHVVTPEEVREALPEFLKISPELEEILDPEAGELSPSEEQWIENMMAGHFLYVQFPYVDPRMQSVDAARGLQVLLQLFKWVRIRDEYHYNCVFHLTEHTAFYYNSRVLIG